MDDKYLAVFSRPSGRVFGSVGEATYDLHEGAPIDEVVWMGDSWTRISDLRHGEAHYVPKSIVV